MSEELRQPAVLDLEALLLPIPGENPSGEYLRYSGLYDEVAESRREDENLNQGEWRTELKVADFRRVIDLVVPALTTQTKDLQLSVWLMEAMVRKNGFVGVRDSLQLLAGLHEHFWDTLHPEIDEGDMEGRANAITWVDSQIAFVLKSAPYTGSAGYGYQDWEDSKRFDFPENLSSLGSEEQKKWSSLKELADSGRRVTGEMWRKEISETRRIAVEKANFTIDECWTAFADLNRLIEEKYDRNQMPGLNGFRKSLEDIQEQVKKLLEEKRIEEPDAILDEPEDDVEGSSSDGTGKAASGRPTGAIQSRRDALKRLAEIADYFQKNEPQSPVSYLVQRAVKWGNMPLESWLQDVIKDDNIINSVRQTLGFNTAGGEAAPEA